MPAVAADGSSLGILLTGSLGHRGSSWAAVVGLIQNIRNTLPGCWIGLATSLVPESQAVGDPKSVGLDCLVLKNYEASTELPRPMNSVLIQCSQVSSLMQHLPTTVTNCIRIRIDWTVEDIQRFKDFLERKAMDLSSLGSVIFNVPKFGSLPMAMQINDQVVFGPRDKVERLWEIPPLSAVKSNHLIGFWSRSLFLYHEATELTAEQILFARYFFGGEIPHVSMNSFPARHAALVTTSEMNFVGLGETGLRPPNGVLPNWYLKPFLASSSAMNRAPRLPQPTIFLGWIFERFLPYLHPIWLMSRAKRVLALNLGSGFKDLRGRRRR